MANSTGTRPAAIRLRVIRMALLAGVLTFGGIVFYLTSQRAPTTTPEAGKAMQMANIAILVAVAVGLLVLQRLHANQADPSKRTALNIAAWAVGETAALFGGVHFLLIGNPTPYLVGLAMMLVSFVLVPIRE
jgi:hypothetical protein